MPPDFSAARFFFFFFFNLVYIFGLQIAVSFMYFATMYFYSYLFYCFMSENSSLELMFMFIQPTLSFLYALLVSRVGKYD